MSRSNHRRADRVGDGFLLPIPSPSGISGFYSQEAINEHVEQYKENTMSFLIRKLVRDNPDKLPLSPDEKYSQSIFLGLESAEEKNDYDKDSFFDGSDDSCCENDDNDESGWIQAMYQFQKYGSNVKYEGSDPLGSEIHFDVAHELHTYTDEESLSEINSDSEEEETIKSSKHDISVLSEKEPPSTSKRKSPEGQESHDGSERIYNGIHARDSKESEDSLSEINSKPDEEESVKCSKQDISVLYEKGLPPASKRKSLECNDSHDGSRRIHIQTHARDNREEVSSEKRREESLSEMNSDSIKEELIKSSKHDISVLSEKEPPSTSKRKSPEGQESHDGSERIYNGIHARDSKEPEDSLSEINLKPDEEESIKCSKQYISVLYEKGLPPASKRKSLEGKDSHDGNRRIHIETHARDNREEVSSEKRPEDELDMSSSLVSGAASSVKHKMDVRLTTPKKKKSLNASEKKKKTMRNNTEIEAAAKKSIDLARPKMTKKIPKSGQTGRSVSKNDVTTIDLISSTGSEKLGKSIVHLHEKSSRTFGRKGRHSSHIRKEKKGKAKLSKMCVGLISIIVIYVALLVYNICT